MAVAFKDFMREKLYMGLRMEGAEMPLARLNEWLEANQIAVINIETLTDVAGRGGDAATATTERGFRVWFRH